MISLAQIYAPIRPSSNGSDVLGSTRKASGLGLMQRTALQATGSSPSQETLEVRGARRQESCIPFAT